MNATAPHLGSSLDNFLKEEGISSKRKPAPSRK